MRAGIGYDIHALAFGRKLVLGGVEIEFAKGARGHSDADVLVHAVMDALLGAAGLGDIGHHFPDTDPRYEGASSIGLLEKVREKLETLGARVVNVDATVILEKPVVSPFKGRMSANIARALKVPAYQVNVKAKTSEGLGEIGSGDAVAAQAIALIEGTGE